MDNQTIILPVGGDEVVGGGGGGVSQVWLMAQVMQSSLPHTSASA